MTGAEIKENPGSEDLKVLSAAMGRFCENGKLNAFTYQPPEPVPPKTVVHWYSGSAVRQKHGQEEDAYKAQQRVEQWNDATPLRRRRTGLMTRCGSRPWSSVSRYSRTAEELQRKSYVPTA